MEEKQAELDNPVEGWNLSVKDVRKILSRKHRPRRSASNDDVVREGDYPMDDDDDDEEQQKVGGAKGRAGAAGEERPTKEPIAEFPISSSRRSTRSSTSSSRDRRQSEEQHTHHHREHHHYRHREHRSSSSNNSANTVSPVISISPVMLAAAAASVDPSSQATVGTSPGKKAPPTGTAPFPTQPASAQKQPPPQISQPSALPPPHLKTPVSMVISRDPRVAKRQQQQLLEKTQSPSSNQQAEVGVRVGSKVDPNSKSPSPATEASPQKSSEVDEVRLRERLLLRQKYRIRKASDRRDSKDDSPEDIQQSPTATTHPPPPPPTSSGSLSQPPPTPPSSVAAPAPIKSCLVFKGSSSTTTSTTSNVNSVSPSPSAAVEPSPQQQEVTRPTRSEQGVSLPVAPQPLRQQQGFIGGGSVVAEEAVEQSTGELELSPHKKAVFVLDAKAAPVDVTSLTPVHVHGGGGGGGSSTTHEVLPDSRVEPETGEVESMNVSSQVPSQAQMGTGSSVAQAEAEATPTIAEVQSRNEGRPESDEDEKDDSSDSSDDDDDRDEKEGGAKQAGGVAIGKCYMDREGAEDEEMGVASDKETREEER